MFSKFTNNIAKRMKQIINIFILFCSLSMLAQPTKTKPTVYVYNSYEDYRDNKPTHTVNLNIKGSYFRPYNYQATRLHDGVRKTKLPLDSIYGYYKDSTFFRYWARKSAFKSNGYFKILDNRNLIVYQYKSFNRLTTTIEYYYSTAMNTEIKRLTHKNLKYDFPNLIKEIDAIKDVTKHLNNQFVVNELLQK